MSSQSKGEIIKLKKINKEMTEKLIEKERASKLAKEELVAKDNKLKDFE